MFLSFGGVSEPVKISKSQNLNFKNKSNFQLMWRPPPRADGRINHCICLIGKIGGQNQAKHLTVCTKGKCELQCDLSKLEKRWRASNYHYVGGFYGNSVCQAWSIYPFVYFENHAQGLQRLDAPIAIALPLRLFCAPAPRLLPSFVLL